MQLDEKILPEDLDKSLDDIIEAVLGKDN